MMLCLSPNHPHCGPCTFLNLHTFLCNCDAVTVLQSVISVHTTCTRVRLDCTCVQHDLTGSMQTLFQFSASLTIISWRRYWSRQHSFVSFKDSCVSKPLARNAKDGPHVLLWMAFSTTLTPLSSVWEEKGVRRARLQVNVFLSMYNRFLKPLIKWTLA